ncbi:hypothetical protein GUITHDRAFT_140454 [Guillardia theta CCMP2712]|uniref:EF-hand domain-containing protein n=1 Tax=Guillardia theta (strain CCMP2712) TaxID=905079 RepID=L1J4H1_GUITC|nr:hypothetical protein GUITHDRAFT_140454 [Guillardia theta CCMP2712]EKX43396.1 hypothetical protein GUITHDRAFT_140454 [Guillardia theta CCMP2712]|eukprot:XP_005830376.1 hypothetical protein GUITHDRAFT_140454 [Guillardia theta CCMP2712]
MTLRTTMLVWLAILFVTSLSFASALAREGDQGLPGASDDAEVDFIKFDEDGDGALNMKEYERMLSENRDRTGGDEGWKSFFVKSDTSGDGRLDFQEFSTAMIGLMEQGGSCGAQEGGQDGEKGERDGGEGKDGAYSDADEPARYALQYDKDGDGKIGFSEFKELMMEDGDTEEEMERGFTAWDKDHDGKLDFSELLLGLTGQGQEPSRDVSDAQEQPADLLPPRELYELARQGRVDRLKYVIDHSYSVDGSAQEGYCTPLHIALIQFETWNFGNHLNLRENRNFAEVARILIAEGADLFHACDGLTALHYATISRCMPAIKEIIKSFRSRFGEAKLDDILLDGTTARNPHAPGGGSILHYATNLHNWYIGLSKIITGHPGAGHVNRNMHEQGILTREMLRENDRKHFYDSFAELGIKISPDILRSNRTTYDRTDLGRLLSKWNSKFVKKLLNAGISHQVLLLLEEGARADQKNLKGMLPADRAVQNGFFEVAELLLGYHSSSLDSPAYLAAAATRDGEQLLNFSTWNKRMRGELPPSPLRGTTSRTAGRRKDSAICEVAEGGRSGGWRRGCLPEVEIDFCDISSIDVSDPAFEEVLRHHSLMHRPLRITGVWRDEDEESLRKIWSKEGLRAASGELGKFKVFRQKGGRKESVGMEMSDYLDFMESHDPALDRAPDWLVEFGLQPGHPLVDSHDKVGGGRSRRERGGARRAAGRKVG